MSPGACRTGQGILESGVGGGGLSWIHTYTVDLEQHVFELCRSTSYVDFFFDKYSIVNAFSL